MFKASTVFGAYSIQYLEVNTLDQNCTHSSAKKGAGGSISLEVGKATYAVDMQ